MIPRIQKGSIITADYLNSIGGAVNRLENVPVKPPMQVGRPPAPAVQNADPSAESSSTYRETSKTTSEVDVYDQDETNYATIQRRETSVFANRDGEEIKLVFDND